MNLVQKIFGTHSERELKRIEGTVQAIENLRPSMQALSDEELRGKTEQFKKRLKRLMQILSVGDIVIELTRPRGAGLYSWRLIKTKPRKELKMAVHEDNL